jgi:hypothetical protein
MRADHALFAPVAAAIASILVAAALELLLRPGPSFARPARAWCIHAGVVCVIVGALTALFGNPWLATGCLAVLFLILVLVGNAKAASLGEPFVFQDYEYFTDMVRYPRLYIPFFGWGNFLVSVAGGLGLLYFAVTQAGSLLRFDWSASAPGGGAVAALGLVCLWTADKSPLTMSFDPQRDLRRYGFVACLWRYGVSSRRLPTVTSPFEELEVRTVSSARGAHESLPHMVAVQSESFFDPRRLYPGIRPDLLAEYDRIKAGSRAWGSMRVPAWGANTIRTEFSFLTGVDNALLGAHRFNPYRALARGWEVMTLAEVLRSHGYRTLCIHPYHRGFYLRDKVMPRMGFDDFWGIEKFAGARRFGPYVSDTSLAETVLDALQEAQEPTFIFAITMENHGPLHLEKVNPGDAKRTFTTPPPAGCDDLTIYLRHLRNADAMIGMLAEGASACDRPVELCWYGDHVPIMTRVYAELGTPCGDVEYVLWSSGGNDGTDRRDLAMDQLAGEWLILSGAHG